MWIIPTTHPLYSHFAPEYLASKEALKEEFEPLTTMGLFQSESAAKPLTLPLMWKSKVLSLQTWLDKWKRAYWLPHLFGRMLKHTMHDRFVERYTESLPDILASHLASPESEKALTMNDTFGRLYLRRLKPADRSLFILKMSLGTLAWDMTKYEETYQVLATELRKESLLRRKLAHPIDESGSLFSELWKTPVSSDGEGGILEIREDADARIKLIDQSVKWGTPRIATNGMMGQSDRPNTSRIEDQVIMWATPVVGELKHGVNNNQNASLSKTVHREQWTTPSTRDYKDTPGMTAERKDGKDRNDQLPRQVYSLLDKENTSTNGKNPARLNPAWSIQLMGTTLQKTFTALLVIRLWSKQQS